MVKLIPSLDVIPAPQEQIDLYFQQAAKQLNDLFIQYCVCDAKGEFATVTDSQLKTHFSKKGWFGVTPLKSIFCGQKQTYMPNEIVSAFRAIMSDAPEEIKMIYWHQFIDVLQQGGWHQSLCAYFQVQHQLSVDDIVMLDELSDMSFSHGVYRLTVRFRRAKNNRVTLYLKQMDEVQSCHEQYYATLQQQYLLTASAAKMPQKIINAESKDVLLVSEEIPGVSSDAVMTALIQAIDVCVVEEKRSLLIQAMELLVSAFINHAVLGDLLGRNDRHLLNSHIAAQQPPKLHLPDHISVFAKSITQKGLDAFSLVDMDMQWLLGKLNIAWILADIECGSSELNLLYLLPHFRGENGYSAEYFSARKASVLNYMMQYVDTLKRLLANKAQIRSTLRQVYPSSIVDEKLLVLSSIIHLFEHESLIDKLFERFLLHYRTRQVYRQTLESLYLAARTNPRLMNALKQTDLLSYLPPGFDGRTTHYHVFVQLQCFRGVLSESDKVALNEPDRTTWETVVASIVSVAKQFEFKLYRDLNNKLELIKHEARVMLAEPRMHLNTAYT